MAIRPHTRQRPGTPAGLPAGEGAGLAIGSGSQASEGGIAIGSTTPVETGSVVIGGTAAKTPDATVVGSDASASDAAGAVAIGADTVASQASGAVVVGAGAVAWGGPGAVAIGRAALASNAEGAIVIGQQAEAPSATGSIVIGAGAQSPGNQQAVVLGAGSAAYGGNDHAMLLGGGISAYGCADAVLFGRGRTLHNLPGCLVAPGPSVLPRERSDSQADMLPAHARRVALDNIFYSAEVTLEAGSVTFSLPPGLYLFPDEVGLIVTAGGGRIEGMTVSALDQAGQPYLQQQALTGAIADRQRFRLVNLSRASGTNTLTVTLDSGPSAGGGMGIVYVRGAVVQLG